MPVQTLKYGPHALAAALFAAIVFQPVDASAGAFTALQGNWSGGGTISMQNGTHERIRCKATYDVSPPGDSLTQTLRCASDSYKFNVDSTVTENGGTISGSWTETTRNVTGSVSGQVSGSVIEVLVTGVGFSAGISLATRGSAQAVAIRPSGDTDVVGVTVSLHKA
jgi:hypothetical protein